MPTKAQLQLDLDTSFRRFEDFEDDVAGLKQAMKGGFADRLDCHPDELHIEDGDPGPGVRTIIVSMTMGGGPTVVRMIITAEPPPVIGHGRLLLRLANESCGCLYPMNGEAFFDYVLAEVQRIIRARVGPKTDKVTIGG